MTSGPVLDPATIATLRQLTLPGEPDVLTEVLQLFLDEVPPRMAKLRNAWAARNIQEVQRVAHSLKGSAGNIGANDMFEVCKRLEGLSGAEAADSAGSLVDAVDVEYQKVEAEIRRLMAARE